MRFLLKIGTNELEVFPTLLSLFCFLCNESTISVEIPDNNNTHRRISVISCS